MRHTTFRFGLGPTPAQARVLTRHAGASRFAYNQCLRLATDALAARRADPQVLVPWSGFDLMNAFNAWKRSEAAGRVFVVAPDGTTTKQITGLGWHARSARRCSRRPRWTSVVRSLPMPRPRAASGRAGSASRGISVRGGAATASGSETRPTAGPAGPVSGWATTIRARLPCQRSARSVYTTTPAGCGGCCAPSSTSNRNRTTDPGAARQGAVRDRQPPRSGLAPEPQRRGARPAPLNATTGRAATKTTAAGSGWTAA